MLLPYSLVECPRQIGGVCRSLTVAVLLGLKNHARKLVAGHYAVFAQERSTSATLQAWAMQARGMCGFSPSKISLIDPTQASLRCDANAFRNWRASAFCPGWSFNHASIYGPISQAHTEP